MPSKFVMYVQPFAMLAPRNAANSKMNIAKCALIIARNAPTNAGKWPYKLVEGADAHVSPAKKFSAA